MKIKELKQEVFQLTCTRNTKQFKKERPELAQGRDLRYKRHWEAILSNLKALREEGLELSLDDLNQSEKMLQESLAKVGKLAGLTKKQIDTDWQRIKLEAQFGDIHIEDL